MIGFFGLVIGIGAAVTVAPLALTPAIDRARQRALRRLVPRVCAILDAHGVAYWADFGTLLGFRRDHDIIVSDKDADLCVLAGEKARIVALAPEFARAGMELTDRGGRSRRVLRICDARTRYHLDVYVYFRDGALLRSELHSPNEDIAAALVERVVDRPFLGGSIKVPADVDAVLRYRYGAGYLIPRRGDKGITRPYSFVRAVLEDVEAGWIGIWAWLRSLTA